MSAVRWLSLLSVATSFGCASSAPETTSDVGGAESKLLAQRVDSLFNASIPATGPGCAVGVYRDGQVVLARGYGVTNVEAPNPITANSTFNIGSGSKAFTALAALMLEQQGKLDLEDDIRKWLPELPEYGTPIRVRDLLYHTSGLRDYEPLHVLGRSISTMGQFSALMSSQRALNFTPGTRHSYSHSDYVMLSQIVERVTGAPFGEHLERTVLAPLGMNGSFVDDHRSRTLKDRTFGHIPAGSNHRVRFPDGLIVGGGNLYTSIADLAHWASNFDDPRVAGNAMSRMVSRPVFPSGDTIPYAYGLRHDTYRGLRTVTRAGHEAGMMSEIMRFPDHKLMVATLCNSEGLEAWRYTQAVADILLDSVMQPKPVRPTAPASVALSKEALSGFVGVYRSMESPWMLLPIELNDGVLGELLFHDTQDDTLFALTPAGGSRFFEIGTTGNIGIFNFMSADSTGRSTLEISWNGVHAETLERIPDTELWKPPASALSEYAGTWFSSDLDTGWKLAIQGRSLVIIRPAQPHLSLWPVSPDQFVRGFGSWVNSTLVKVQFHRNDARQLTHFTVSTPGGDNTAQEIRFDRVVQ